MKFKFRKHLKFPHPIRDTFLLKVKLVSRDVLEGLLDALGAFLEHLKLLIAQGHVVEKDKQVEFVATAQIEIDDIHYPVGFLQEVEGLLPLLSLDELGGRVIKLPQDYWNFILGDAKLLVVMLVKGVILVESTSLRPVCLVIAVAPL